MMRLHFVKSAQFIEQFPMEDRPEIAIVGRSNSGKSSFLNALSSQKIAKVSSTPGKTRLLNFFDVGDKYRIVDMPGYGFAAVDNREAGKWKSMIETYLNERESLVGLILIMDARRNWQQEEEQIIQWSAESNVPVVVCLNKVDRMKKNEARSNLLKFKKQFPDLKFFNTSAKTEPGVTMVEDYAFTQWVSEVLK
ncbi:MAG: ribosome biogenesis GTP-binding protein YsxC [Bdellovibrionaceae bacterium]|jgi:GTP-binding protein|nr:ribosome biogenesis GTP-binding protein YsxC [Pseudobdellovibrionaceae bacterium]